MKRFAYSYLTRIGAERQIHSLPTFIPASQIGCQHLIMNFTTHQVIKVID